jgi:hypothetical protein
LRVLHCRAVRSFDDDTRWNMQAAVEYH